MLSRPTGQHVENVRVSDGSHFNATIHNNTYNGIQRTLFEILSPASQASYDSWTHDGRSFCLDGTRIRVLEEIRSWINSDENSIFWLNGIAGAGKSTIAKTIAQELREGKRLGASFFFKSGEGDLSSSRKFVSTVAYQLTRHIPRLEAIMLEVVQAQPDIVEKSRMEQWTQLVVEPLNRLQKTAGRETWFIVVDTLDECDNDDEITALVAILAEARQVQTIKLRAIITSRPEPPVPLGFRTSGPEIRHYDLLLHDVPRMDVDEDIRRFYVHQFQRMKARWQWQSDWPGIDEIDQLVTEAAGLFIFAATVCLYIVESNDPADLGLFLPRVTDGQNQSTREQNATSARPAWHLDQMYGRILGRRSATTRPEGTAGLGIEFSKQVIASIAILREPLSTQGLAQLLELGPNDMRVRALLSRLHSVVRVPANGEDPVRFHHESFRDFLLDEQRSSETGLTIDRQETHGRLLRCCLSEMRRRLRQNICGLPDPGVRVPEIAASKIAEALPTSVQYACQYWVHHCCEVESEPSEILSFLHDHLLQWIEAMSLMGKVADAIHMIVQLQQHFDGPKNSRQNSSKTRTMADDNIETQGFGEVFAFLHDARRVLLLSRAGVEEAPLQIYEAALSLAPMTSLVRQHFLPRSMQLVQRIGEVDHEWDACVQTLAGHTHKVLAITFAPNGRTFASTSMDDSIRLWETATGRCIQTFQCHMLTGAVTFAPDSRILASVSLEAFTPYINHSVIRLWETATGQCVRKLVPKARVTAIAFSPDGRTLATGLSDGDGMIWEVASGRWLQHMKTTSPVQAVAFAPDGQVLALGQHIFNLKQGKCLRSLEYSPEAIAFMRDSQRMVTIGSIKGWPDQSPPDRPCAILQIYETAISGNVQTMCHERLTGRERAFTSDGRLLVTAWESVVRIWDVPSGQCVLEFATPSFITPIVALAPDANTVAFGLTSGEVQIWETTSEQRVSNTPAVDLQTRWVRSIEFAPDGKTFASASLRTRIYETATGRCIRELKGSSRSRDDQASNLAFSPDGEKLAVDWTYEITIYQVTSGQPVQTLTCSTIYRDKLRFSSDGTKLESTSFDTRYSWALNSSASTPASGDRENSGHDQNSVRIDQSWVVVDDMRLIRLPPRFNDVRCHARYGSALALGHKSGLVSLWKVRASSYEGLTDVEMEDI